MKSCSAPLPTLRFLQRVAPLRRIALEPALPVQLLQRQDDFAAIVAAHRRHQVLEELRSVAQRGLDRGKALALEARRLRNFRLERALGSDRKSTRMHSSNFGIS